MGTELLETCCRTVCICLVSCVARLHVQAKLPGPCGEGEVLRCTALHRLWTRLKCRLLWRARVNFLQCLFVELGVMLCFFQIYSHTLCVEADF